jgi:opacity protein-like surface antigen
MMRDVRVVTALVVFMLAGAAVSHAQTTTEPMWYGEFTIAATLGHKSDKAVGGEAGMRITPDLDVFVEAGHMGNVGTTDLEARAQIVADFIGGTVGSTAHKVNFGVFGVRYHLPMIKPIGKWHPYLAFGAGLARVKPEVTFAVNGTDVTGRLPEFGVQLGSDLTDSLNKAMIVVGGGATMDFKTRYLVDLSYRYGHILGKTGDIENDVAIKTQRVQIGVGVRF